MDAETQDLKELRALITWWTNWRGGILVGQMNDGKWQAACQHPNLSGVAFHGPTPRFALEQARIALTAAARGPNTQLSECEKSVTPRRPSP